MQYTKSEIRKVKNTLHEQLAVIKRYTQLQIPNAQIGIAEICHAENAVRIISGALQVLRDYVIDENDHQYGCDLELEVRNTFDLFLEKAHGEKERLNGAIPGEMYLNDISETMVDLIDWLDETEEKPQDTPTISREAGKPKYIINDNVLNVLPKLYVFLVNEKVINGDKVSCTDYTRAIENADISAIYPNSVKYKFKTTIKTIQKSFTDDWFVSICKSANVSEASMGKSNFSDDTAKSQWFRKLDKIVTDL